MAQFALKRKAGGDDHETGGNELQTDTVYETLKNSRRRMTLAYLAAVETPVTISDLSEHVASLETGTPSDKLDSQDRKRVYVGLYQCHLPKMDDAGIVEFEKNRGLIDRGVNFEQVTAHMEDDSTTVEWAMLLTALVGLGTLLAEVALGEPTVLSRIVLGIALLALVIGASASLANVEFWR